MKYYDSNGVEHEYDLSDNIGHGWCGDVYRYNYEWVVKIYRDYCSKRLRLKKGIFDIISDINSDYIIEIKDLLYKDSKINKNTSIDGYTCRYISPDRVDMLSSPTDYFLDNLNELSKVFTEISSRGVRVYDLKGSNVIVKNDRIVLIDVDMFYKVRTSTNKLDKLNKLDLLRLFKEIFSDAVYDYGHNFNYLDAIDEIFLDCSKSKDVVVEVQKQFQKYKCPADYLRSKL